MSAQINSSNFTNIGRMFARQNVPAVYGMQKAAAEAEPEAATEAVDRVSLSAFAPRPLSADLFRDAAETARVMGSGGTLTDGQSTRLREDRVFAAVAALANLGSDGEDAMQLGWPGGLPAPTNAEMEAARRRLAQRLSGLEEAEDADAVQTQRLEVLRRTAGRKFENFALPEAGTAAALAAAS